MDNDTNTTNSTTNSTAVVMEGELTGRFDESMPPDKLGWKVKLHGGTFFYEHVCELLKRHIADLKSSGTSPEPFYTELIPIEDYLFRYDYGAFWMARPMAFEWSKVFSYFPFVIGLFVASYRWVRLVTGAMFTTSNLFQMLKCAPESVVASKMVVQDCYIPTIHANNFLSWVQKAVPLSTPLWLCPVRTNNNQPFTPSYSITKKSDALSFLLNCGVYGRVSDGHGVEYTRQLEAKCQEFRGRKMLYAQNHYSEEMFWFIFNKSEYEQLREAHFAKDAFPSVFEKACGVQEPKNTWYEAIISLFL